MWGDSTRRRTGSRSLTHRDARVSHELTVVSSPPLPSAGARAAARRGAWRERAVTRRGAPLFLGDGAAARRTQVRAAHGDGPDARPGRALHPHVCGPELPHPRAGVHRGRTRGLRTSSLISNELPPPTSSSARSSTWPSRRTCRRGRSRTERRSRRGIPPHTSPHLPASRAPKAEYLPIPPRISPHLAPRKRNLPPSARGDTHSRGALDTLPGAALPS